MRAPSSTQLLVANPFTRTEGQLLFTWWLARVALQDLTSCHKLTIGNKDLHVYRMMMRYIARDDPGLSLVRSKDAARFLKWIM